MDFVHAKPVEAALFYRLWNTMPVHNRHILSHFVTFCHILSQIATVAPSLASVVPSPASVSATVPHKIYLFFSNVLSKGYIQQQEGCKYPTEYSDS